MAHPSLISGGPRGAGGRSSGWRIGNQFTAIELWKAAPQLAASCRARAVLTHPKVDGRASQQCLSRQVPQHGLASFLGFRERVEGRAADLDGARFLMMDRTPGRHEAGSSMKAGTAAALIADHERKAVAASAPYFYVRDGTNDAAELHGHSHRRPTSSVGSPDDQTLSQRWFQARQHGYPRKAPAPTEKRAAGRWRRPGLSAAPRRTHR